MAADHSTSAVIKAIVGNGIVTVAKGVATVASGSGAMLAETVHSLVDTLNQCLLLIGQKRALKAPTHRFPYGFGPEANFWGVLAAVGILIFGGGLSIEHSIKHLAHPSVPDSLGLAIGVLIFAIVIEGWVLYSVMKGIDKTRGDTPWRTHLPRQAPGTIFVLIEDAAAVLGCFIALAAIAMCVITGNGFWDALAQLVIGIMLTVVGLYLLWRNRGVLIGQSLPARRVSAIQQYIEDLPGIDRITKLKTRQLTATTFRLTCEVVFNGGWVAGGLMEEWDDVVMDAGDAGKAREVLGRFADKLFEAQARHVDWLESEIREEFPGALYIDLEPHLRDV